MTTRTAIERALKAVEADFDYVEVYAVTAEDVYAIPVYAETLTDNGVEGYSYEELYLTESEAFNAQEELIANAESEPHKMTAEDYMFEQWENSRS